jgi:hypothetical protein
METNVVKDAVEIYLSAEIRSVWEISGPLLKILI